MTIVDAWILIGSHGELLARNPERRPDGVLRFARVETTGRPAVILATLPPFTGYRIEVAGQVAAGDVVDVTLPEAERQLDQLDGMPGLEVQP